MSTAFPPDTIESIPAPAAPRRRWSWRRYVILALILLWMLQRIPHEVSYWLLASAQNRAAAGDVNGALDIAKSAAGWTPREKLPGEVQAQILWDAHRRDEAVKEVVAVDPRSSFERLELVWRLLLLQRDDDALQVLRATKWRGSGEIPYRVMIARRLVDRQREADAFQSLEVLPSPAVSNGKSEGASGWFDSLSKRLIEAGVAESDGDYDDVLRMRSELLKSLGRYEEALASLDKCVQQDPRSWQSSRQDLLLHLNRGEEVLTHLKSDEEKAGGPLKLSVVALNQHAYLRGVLNQDLELAEQQAEAAVKEQPDNAALLDTCGYVRYRLKKYEEGLADLDRALSLLDDEIKEIHEQVKEAGKSVSSLQVEVVLDQVKHTGAVLFYHRALLHEALGKKAEAEADLRRVREFGFEPNEHLF